MIIELYDNSNVFELVFTEAKVRWVQQVVVAVLYRNHAAFAHLCLIFLSFSSATFHVFFLWLQLARTLRERWRLELLLQPLLDSLTNWLSFGIQVPILHNNLLVIHFVERLGVARLANSSSASVLRICLLVILALAENLALSWQSMAIIWVVFIAILCTNFSTILILQTLILIFRRAACLFQHLIGELLLLVHTHGQALSLHEKAWLFICLFV